MEKAFFIQLISYAPLLKAARIIFKEDEKCLNVGKITASTYALFISCRTLDTPEMLNDVLPLLKSSQVPFRLIKNQNLQYRLNAGSFGENEAGKAISIFPNTVIEAIALANRICEATEKYKGPIIPEAQRIGKIVFVQMVTLLGNNIKLTMPNVRNLPFTIPKLYLAKKKNNSILGRFFLPVQILRSSPKGNIYKGINLKRLAFNWCTIKQGNPVALDDHFDRDMRDRLLWQKEAIEQLSPTVYTPHIIDYFEKNESSYLVLNFADGESFGHIVREILAGTEWTKVGNEKKSRLIGYFLRILDLVNSIHEQEFVHRDITDSNFLVMDDDSVCIIDFELSYSLREQRPDPPFLLGTYGYAAPEQLQYALPDITEDIYSLGALLSFTISGCQPHEFLATTPQIIKAKIQRLSGSNQIAAIISKCLQHSRKDRPTIAEIRTVVLCYLETFNHKPYEKIAMAI